MACYFTDKPIDMQECPRNREPCWSFLPFRKFSPIFSEFCRSQKLDPQISRLTTYIIMILMDSDGSKAINCSQHPGYSTDKIGYIIGWFQGFTAMRNAIINDWFNCTIFPKTNPAYSSMMWCTEQIGCSNSSTVYLDDVWSLSMHFYADLYLSTI